MTKRHLRWTGILFLPLLLMSVAATPTSTGEAPLPAAPEGVQVVDLYGTDFGGVALPTPLSAQEMAQLSGGWPGWVYWRACGTAAGIVAMAGAGAAGGAAVMGGCIGYAAYKEIKAMLGAT